MLDPRLVACVGTSFAVHLNITHMLKDPRLYLVLHCKWSEYEGNEARLVWQQDPRFVWGWDFSKPSPLVMPGSFNLCTLIFDY